MLSCAAAAQTPDSRLTPSTATAPCTACSVPLYGGTWERQAAVTQAQAWCARSHRMQPVPLHIRTGISHQPCAAQRACTPHEPHACWGLTPLTFSSPQHVQFLRNCAAASWSLKPHSSYADRVPASVSVSWHCRKLELESCGQALHTSCSRAVASDPSSPALQRCVCCSKLGLGACGQALGMSCSRAGASSSSPPSPLGS